MFCGLVYVTYIKSKAKQLVSQKEQQGKSNDENVVGHTNENRFLIYTTSALIALTSIFICVNGEQVDDLRPHYSRPNLQYVL